MASERLDLTPCNVFSFAILNTITSKARLLCSSHSFSGIHVQAVLRSWMKECSGMGINIDEKCFYTFLLAANGEADREYMTRKLMGTNI